jgi:hypothetical protein
MGTTRSTLVQPRRTIQGGFVASVAQGEMPHTLVLAVHLKELEIEPDLLQHLTLLKRGLDTRS